MGFLGHDLGPGAGDLGLQCSDVVLQLRDRHAIEILGLDGRLARLEIVDIHGGPPLSVRDGHHKPRHRFAPTPPSRSMSPMADALPASMTAIEIVKPGKPEGLVPTTRPVPKPATGELPVPGGGRARACWPRAAPAASARRRSSWAAPSAPASSQPPAARRNAPPA